MIVDKTGTLTEGKPEVTDIIVSGLDQKTVLKLVASVEKNSEHPLGEAIVRAAVERGLAVPDAEEFSAIPGHGVEARHI